MNEICVLRCWEPQMKGSLWNTWLMLEAGHVKHHCHYTDDLAKACWQPPPPDSHLQPWRWRGEPEGNEEPLGEPTGQVSKQRRTFMGASISVICLLLGNWTWRAPLSRLCLQLPWAFKSFSDLEVAEHCAEATPKETDFLKNVHQSFLFNVTHTVRPPSRCPAPIRI